MLVLLRLLNGLSRHASATAVEGPGDLPWPAVRDEAWQNKTLTERLVSGTGAWDWLTQRSADWCWVG
jgi:hypothetical protein